MPNGKNDTLVAARYLRDGGVVAHATEGVWGLACDPFDEDAVTRLLAIKRRPHSQGLIVVAAAPEDFDEEIAALPGDAVSRIRESWPGAVTWLVPNLRFPEWVVGEHATVAIRVPAHAQARELAAAFGGPIVSTSANRSGEPPALSYEEAQTLVGDEVDWVLPGATGGHEGPSRIMDALSSEVMR